MSSTTSRIDRLMAILGEQRDEVATPLTDIAKLNRLIHVLSSSIYGGSIDPGLPKLVNLLDPDAKVETPEAAKAWVEYSSPLGVRSVRLKVRRSASRARLVARVQRPLRQSRLV